MTVHIAGHPYRFGNRARQLCAWCGAPILDEAIPEGKHWIYWTVGHYVEVSDGRLSMPVHHGRPPAGCCVFVPGLKLV